MYQRNLCCYASELCETMRNYMKLCETIRNYAKLYETMRNYAKLCETMRNYAKLYETIRNYAKLYETMQNYCILLLYFYYCIFTAPQAKTKPVRPRTLGPPSQNQAGPAQDPWPIAVPSQQGPSTPRPITIQAE